jgi:competence protein ComGC
MRANGTSNAQAKSMKLRSPHLNRSAIHRRCIFHAQCAHSTRAVTLVEVICVVAGLSMLAILILPLLAHSHRHTTDMKCRNNLKNIGLAYRIWATDNNDVFPFQVSTNKGGVLELTNDIAAQFSVLSNELSTPKILLCPRHYYTLGAEATNWVSLGPQNISFFVGIDGSETNVDSILSGDTGFTIDGADASPGLLRLNASSRVVYPKDLHTKPNAVNICMGDGSVPQIGAKDLPKLLTKSGAATNRFILP